MIQVLPSYMISWGTKVPDASSLPVHICQLLCTCVPLHVFKRPFQGLNRHWLQTKFNLQSQCRPTVYYWAKQKTVLCDQFETWHYLFWNGTTSLSFQRRRAPRPTKDFAPRVLETSANFNFSRERWWFKSSEVYYYKCTKLERWRPGYSVPVYNVVWPSLSQSEICTFHLTVNATFSSSFLNELARYWPGSPCQGLAGTPVVAADRRIATWNVTHTPAHDRLVLCSWETHEPLWSCE